MSIKLEVGDLCVWESIRQFNLVLKHIDRGENYVHCLRMKKEKVWIERLNFGRDMLSQFTKLTIYRKNKQIYPKV